MKFKGHTFTGIDQFINEDNDKKLKGAWKNSLGHQIASTQLPEYDVVRQNLTILFTKHFAK